MTRAETKIQLRAKVDELTSSLRETEEQLKRSAAEVYRLKRLHELCTCLKGKDRKKAEDYTWLVKTLKNMGFIPKTCQSFNEIISALSKFERKQKEVNLAVELFYGTLHRAGALPEED